MIDYFATNLWLAWLCVSVLCLVTELCSGDLYIICCALGAMASTVCALIGLPLWAQVLVFAVASVVCIIFVRPSMMRSLHGEGKERKSNADALIGKRGVVIETIPSDGHGYVKIAGDEWRSVSGNGEEIIKGTSVTVVERESTILTVTTN